MDIESVELKIPSKEKANQGAKTFFLVKVKGDTESVAIVVPASKDNRHYWEVGDWLDKQDPKPFEYDFEIEG